MVLSEFTYREASGWHVERLKLNLQNLIVGLNSVGKSRTISAIGHVASFIKGEVDAQGDFSCSLLLENGSSLEYSFDVVGGQVLVEELKKEGKTLIHRDFSSVKMYDDDTVSPPGSKLLIQVRRDTKQYPEIEEIIQWAEHTSIFVFSNITTSPNSLSPYVISKEPLLPVMFSSISVDPQEMLKAYMPELGYDVREIKDYAMPSRAKS